MTEKQSIDKHPEINHQIYPLSGPYISDALAVMGLAKTNAHTLISDRSSISTDV